MKAYPELLEKTLKSIGLKKLTPVQETLLPPAFEKRDVLAIGAQEQDGLCEAIALILLARVQRNTGKFNLAIMSSEEAAKNLFEKTLTFMKDSSQLGLLSALGDFEQQEKQLDSGLKCWVCTPKQLVAHLKVGNISLSQTDFLVLQNLDRMLKDKTQLLFLNEGLRFMPRTRQTISLVAEVTPDLTKNLTRIMKDPVKVDLPHGLQEARQKQIERVPPRMKKTEVASGSEKSLA
jgi:ATP-dependent RNA helicase RhlE